MNTQEVQDRVFAVVSKQFNIPVDEVSPMTLLVEELGADSAGFVELSARIEDTFNTQLPDLRHLADRELRELIEFVANYLHGPSAARAAGF